LTPLTAGLLIAFLSTLLANAVLVYLYVTSRVRARVLYRCYAALGDWSLQRLRNLDRWYACSGAARPPGYNPTRWWTHAVDHHSPLLVRYGVNPRFEFKDPPLDYRIPPIRRTVPGRDHLLAGEEIKAGEHAAGIKSD
jgi:hypothetical protein